MVLRLRLSLILGAILACSVAQAERFTLAPSRLDSGLRTQSINPSIRSFVANYDRHQIGTYLPTDAKSYRYVMVPGLFAKLLPFYMSRSTKALRSAGLDVEVAPINSAASVKSNTAILKRMIKTSDRPIVFVGHSKGVSDAAEAISELAAKDPGFVQHQVRGLVSLEGSYRGSPLADWFAARRWRMGVIHGLAWLAGGSVQSVLDLRVGTRSAAVARHPMPTQLVPTVAFIGHTSTLRSSILAPLTFLMSHRFDEISDGMVGHREAFIEGAEVVRMPADHRAGAFGALSEKLTLGLIRQVLTLQPRVTFAPSG